MKCNLNTQLTRIFLSTLSQKYYRVTVLDYIILHRCCCFCVHPLLLPHAAVQIPQAPRLFRADDVIAHESNTMREVMKP